MTRKIRVSLGTAIVLGLDDGTMDRESWPKTAYLMLWRPYKCSANCAFCPQASTSSSKADRLSRVSWPVYNSKSVIIALQEKYKEKVIQRACLQVLNVPDFFEEVVATISVVRKTIPQLPISLSIQPLNRQQLEVLNDLKISSIGIPIDASTSEIFQKIKGENIGGPYRWETHRKALREAIAILGKGRVTTHLIVGLGETEKEMCNIIQELTNEGIRIGLFAFTPVFGSNLANRKPPSHVHYWKMQLARYLIQKREKSVISFSFENGKLKSYGIPQKELITEIEKGTAFLTSGCPKCNRPYYNERPGKTLYNFPRPLKQQEINEVRKSVLGDLQ